MAKVTKKQAEEELKKRAKNITEDDLKKGTFSFYMG